MLNGILGSLGLLGILFAILLGAALLLILPVWSIVDCVRSNRSSGDKALIITLLCVFWGLAPVVYALFITKSRAMRLVALSTAIAIPVLAIVGFGAMMKGYGALSEKQRERQAVEDLEREKRFHRDAGQAVAMEPVEALLLDTKGMVTRSATLVRFALPGPEASEARNVDPNLRHVVHDRAHDRWFAATVREFGTLDPKDGAFTRIQVEPNGSLDTIHGLAFDPARRRIVVLTSHVFTRFYAYAPETGSWARLSEIRDLPLSALAYSEIDDCFYGLEESRRAAEFSTLHRFSPSGGKLATLALRPAIPVRRGANPQVQMQGAPGRFVLIVAGLEGRDEAKLFVIDARTGAVSIPQAAGPPPA